MIRIALLMMTILLTGVLLASGIGTATALRSKQSGARHPPSPATEHKGSKRHIGESPKPPNEPGRQIKSTPTARPLGNAAGERARRPDGDNGDPRRPGLLL